MTHAMRNMIRLRYGVRQSWLRRKPRLGLISCSALLGWALLLSLSGIATAQEATPPPPSKELEEARQERTLYVVGTAHLDTQWLWTIQTTIDEFIPNTLRHNFDRIDKYPDYVFSFEGAFRYMLAREYYPEDFARMKKYIDEGRWAVCGSWVDAVDVNVPSPESLIRHVLYGNGYFEREFGKTSCDVFLPDCFGFGYALPSVAAHCGLTGFSTQKLTWGSSVGIPFERVQRTDAEGKEHEIPLGLGVWEGVNGDTLIAAVNPGSYVSKLRENLSTDDEWRERIDAMGKRSGLYLGYKYFGVGDQGGAPDDESVGWLQKSIDADGPITVKSAPADQLFRDLTPQQVAELPRYKGELLMTRHGVGCYTSQAVMKRWNRQCELLADTAERAAVIADWLGGATYPHEKLNEAWIRFLWHQFHDDLTGTSIPEAYPFSWNDQLLSLNQFAEVLRVSVGVVARHLDTDVEGEPLVVFNPLSIGREEVVDAAVKFDGSAPSAISVHDGEGNPVPFQMMGGDADTVLVAFLARVPPLGAAVYEVRPASSPQAPPFADRVTAGPSTLENADCRVTVNSDGDIVSVFDKKANRELLRGPVQLQMLRNDPNYWPEWEIDYDDISARPYTCVSAPAEIRVIESGPVRAALEVSRTANESTIVQTISLTAGERSNCVEIETCIDWRSPRTLLKAAFPLSVADEKATYDLGLGTVQRGNNHEELYEVPAQQWADLTDKSGDYGVAILNDCKYGWDKPADDMIRLTLVHSPDSVEKEMGFHRLRYAITGHEGTWQQGDVPWRAARLNQPLTVFRAGRHEGNETRLSIAAVDNRQVAIKAFKKTESGDAYIVRVQELHGRPAQGIRFEACAALAEVCEVTGAEKPLPSGIIPVDGSGFHFNMKPYQVRTFSVRMQEPAEKLSMPTATSIELAFDVDAVSLDADKSDGDFDGQGRSLPGELLPDRLIVEDIPFELGSDSPGELNALTCRGQQVKLPRGSFGRLYLLAAMSGDAALAPFKVDDRYHGARVHPITGYLGLSNCFIIDGKRVPVPHQTPPFMTHAPVAWIGTHRHSADGRNEPYVFTYLHKCVIDLPEGADSITLPEEPNLKIFAMTVADNPNEDTTAACDLYDNVIAPAIDPQDEVSIYPIVVNMSVQNPDAVIRFTVDGSEPTMESMIYEGPFRIDRSRTIHARAFVDGKPNAYVARRSYRIVKPTPALSIDEPIAGLNYRCFKGTWPKLPSLDGLEPYEVGTTEQLAVEPKTVEPTYVVEYTGCIEVPREGVYSFKTRSNKASRLYIAGDLVVDNTSWRFIPMERFGSIALSPGLHEFKVEYLQYGEEADIQVECAGPDLERQPLPREAFFRPRLATMKPNDAREPAVLAE